MAGKKKDSLKGALVRRTFTGPSKAPYGGSMQYQEPGFHKKPDGSEAVEVDKRKKRDKVRKSAGYPPETDAQFFKHTTKGK